MKKVHLTVVLIYLFISLYFAIFNWDVFTVSLNVSFGFAVFKMPLIALLLLFGLALLLIQMMMANMSAIKRERDLLQKDNELMALKVSHYDESLPDIQHITEDIKNLQAKLEELAKNIQAGPREKPGGDKKEALLEKGKLTPKASS